MAVLETLSLTFNDPMENVATIRIDRPKALNALNTNVIRDLNLALDEVEKNKQELRGLVITGSGDRAFMAGADISAMVKMSPVDARTFLHSAQRSLDRIENLSLPTIARINGYALGGGLELALACDIRIASDNAILGLPEVSLGLIPAAGGTQRLTRIVGEGVSKYMIITAERITADEAKSRGIVSKVVPYQELDEEINKLLSKIISMGPIAISSAKRAIEASLNENLQSGLEIELDEAIVCFQTKDLREGMNAFIEKRKAEFKGI